MNTKAKSNSVITHNLGIDTDTKQEFIAFDVLGAGQVRLYLDLIHSDNLKHAAIHGMIQRISDAAAISRDPATGLPATAQEKFEAMTRLAEHYNSGNSEWSRRPVAGEGKSGGLLFKALCIMSAETKTADEIREWMSAKTKAQLTALRNSPKVAAIIAELRPVSIEVDADALMDELNA